MMKKFNCYMTKLACRFPQTISQRVVRRPRRLAPLLAVVAVVLAGLPAFAQNPPFADGAFCTRKRDFFQSVEAAQRIQSNPPFSTTDVNRPFVALGAVAPGFAYVWTKTGTQVNIAPAGQPPVNVDTGIAALRDALGAMAGPPSAFTANMINARDMGTGGLLAVQAMVLNLNSNFSDAAVVTPRGFSFLNLTNMEKIKLGGVALTPDQAKALNGQAVLQVLDAANRALGTGKVPFGLSFAQLTELIENLNAAFSDSFKDAMGNTQPCGHASTFAQNNVYQPYLISNAFAGKKPIGNATFLPKASGGMFSGGGLFFGEVVNVGRGCPAGSISMGSPEDPFLANPAGKIALIERGACRFDNKIARAVKAGATAVIIFNSAAGGEGLGFLGGNNPVTLPDGTMVNINIPAVFVQRSTGQALISGTAPVTVIVQQ